MNKIKFCRKNFYKFNKKDSISFTANIDIPIKSSAASIRIFSNNLVLKLNIMP